MSESSRVPRSTAYQRMLDATAKLIREHGPDGVTLERVCKGAKVSKGGFFHHFKNKSALLETLIDDLVSHLEKEIEARIATEKATSLGAARAYLAAVAATGELPRGRQRYQALSVICAAYPELIPRLKKRAGRWSQARWGARPVPVEELQLWLIGDGLWMADLCGCYHITPKLRAALLRKFDLSAAR